MDVEKFWVNKCCLVLIRPHTPHTHCGWHKLKLTSCQRPCFALHIFHSNALSVLPDFLTHENARMMLCLVFNCHTFCLYFHRVMAFIIGLPVIQIILFCWAIGHDPTGLKLAVANHEIGTDDVLQQTCPLTKGCNYTYLSCRYLEFLKLNKSMILVSVCCSISRLVLRIIVDNY